MEYAKDEMFEVRYNTKLDRLVIKKERLRSKVWRKIKKHKLLSITVSSFILFSIVNFIMIYNFMKILQNI